LTTASGARAARALTSAAFAAGCGLAAWGTVEARLLERRELQLPVPGLPRALDGLRVLHLSDVHPGYGPGLRTLRDAVQWAAELDPDLAVITGDLVARRRAEPRFRALAAELSATTRHGAFAVLGNHDHAEGNDPFATGGPVTALDGVDLLGQERRQLVVRGTRVCLVGVDAKAWLKKDRPYDITAPLDRTADLRVLLCHYPSSLEKVRSGDFQLILAGHIHGGQICLPWPGGRVGLAHPSERYLRGVFQRENTVMHVSPGLGTTFVPFRLLARPQATLLELRYAPRV
jgi:predicted MPP superfamily phosphohydrolase